MYKYTFFDDYSEGAHPTILKQLAQHNENQESGYGNDTFSIKAQALIKHEINNPDATVHLLSGGTQANIIVLASLLKPYESIIAPVTAHINQHEAGAIEATGHKINAVPTSDGKLHVDLIKSVIDSHKDEHMVKPKVVFISNSTEVGTLYKKAELESISEFCHQNNLYLYLDGARIGSGLSSKESDVTLADVARLVDVFYIGGTKNGALLGEAIVITNKNLQSEFRYHLKQRGALLAKGRILGIQFVGLFTDNLYFELAKHANTMAERLTRGIEELGFNFLTNSTTNQIFPIFPNSLIEELKKQYGFYVWSEVDESNSTIRLVTSWATKEEKVEEFLTDVRLLTEKHHN